MKRAFFHWDIGRQTRLLLPVFASLLALLPISPLNKIFASRDSGVFMYIAWRILNGEVPYRDVWDHKPPLIYFIDALGLALFPNSTWGIWILEFVFLLCACYLSFKLFEKNFGLFSAVASLYFWVISFFISFAGGNLTTEYTILFQFAIFYLFQKDLEKTSRWNYYWLGFFTSLSFFARQNSIGSGLAIALFYFVDAVKLRNWRNLRVQYSLLFLGIVSVAIPIVIYFALHHALWDFWDAGFVYNFYYVDERTRTDRFVAILRGIDWLSQTGLSQLALCGLAWYLITLIRRSSLEDAKKSFLWVALISFPIEIYFIGLGGRPRIPYYLALLPVFSIFAAYFVKVVQDFVAQLVKPKLATGLLSVLLLLMVVFQVNNYYNVVMGYRQIDNAVKVVEYIAQNTTTSDYVLMWGAESSVNFYAKRPSPTKYVYQYPLYKAKYAGVDRLEDFFSDIIQKRPKLIIMTTGLGKIPRGFSSRDERTDMMADTIRSMYEKETRIGDWVVFKRVDTTQE